MGKPRCLQAQQAVQIQLPCRGRKQVCTAHHFGNAHAGIVHHHGQLIGEHAIRPAQVEITAVVQKIFGVRAHAAIHKCDVLVRHHQTVGRGLLFAFFLNFGSGQAAAGARIDHVAVRGMGRAGRVQLGAGAKTRVHKAALFQLFVACGVDLRALTLVIGAVRPTGAAALVPRKAQPVQILFQQVSIDAWAALGIQILNAQHDTPALTFCAEPRQQAAGQIAKMQPPAGAGGKAAGWRHRLCFLRKNCLFLHVYPFSRRTI